MEEDPQDASQAALVPVVSDTTSIGDLQGTTGSEGVSLQNQFTKNTTWVTLHTSPVM